MAIRNRIKVTVQGPTHRPPLKFSKTLRTKRRRWWPCPQGNDSCLWASFIKTLVSKHKLLMCKPTKNRSRLEGFRQCRQLSRQQMPLSWFQNNPPNLMSKRNNSPRQQRSTISQMKKRLTSGRSPQTFSRQPLPTLTSRNLPSSLRRETSQRSNFRRRRRWASI
jgi:hypothetical protein